MTVKVLLLITGVVWMVAGETTAGAVFMVGAVLYPGDRP